MVSTSFAPRNSAAYAMATANSNLQHSNQQQQPPPSQAQYLKEAFGVIAPTSNNSSSGTYLGNDTEWPSLGMAMFANEALVAHQQRALAANSARRSSATGTPQNRRPVSIGARQPDNSSVRAMSHHPQQQQQHQPPLTQKPSATIKNPKLYKTELCRSWAETGRCGYNDRCQYAHGEAEKRPIPRHPKYKTEACQSFHQSGYCAYGARCHFIHNEDAQMLAQMIAANAAAVAANSAKHHQGGVSLATHANHFGHVQQQQQQPAATLRPNTLFAGANGGIPQSPSLAYGHQNNANNNQLLGRQFQNQLQLFNDALKQMGIAQGASIRVPTQPAPQAQQQQQQPGVTEVNSTGDSPIPSDSGSDSPLCSFSPGSAELENNPAFVFVRKQLEAIKLGPSIGGPAGVGELQNPLNLLPSSLNSDIESGFSSSSSTSSNVGTKSLNSPIVGSPPHGQQQPPPTQQQSAWSVGTPTGSRLPVFERLSNGP